MTYGELELDDDLRCVLSQIIAGLEMVDSMPTKMVMHFVD